MLPKASAMYGAAGQGVPESTKCCLCNAHPGVAWSLRHKFEVPSSHSFKPNVDSDNVTSDLTALVQHEWKVSVLAALMLLSLAILPVFEPYGSSQVMSKPIGLASP